VLQGTGKVEAGAEWVGDRRASEGGIAGNSG
jgi:hypothetical protein